VSAYAIAHLRTPHINAEVLAYIERIQETMNPFGGRFLVHGGEVDAREGSWPGTVVVIEFPDMAQARTWYDSSAYQEILPLRTRNIEGEAILVDGVGPDYDASRTARRLRAGIAR